MKRSLIVFIGLGLLFGLVGCGGSGINAERDQDRAIVITDFLAGVEGFPGSRAQAGCVLDEVFDELDITYADARASIENNGTLFGQEFGQEEVDVDDEVMEILFLAAVDCGVNPFG